jgi:hypothetical protein
MCQQQCYRSNDTCIQLNPIRAETCELDRHSIRGLVAFAFVEMMSTNVIGMLIDVVAQVTRVVGVQVLDMREVTAK